MDLCYCQTHHLMNNLILYMFVLLMIMFYDVNKSRAVKYRALFHRNSCLAVLLFGTMHK